MMSRIPPKPAEIIVLTMILSMGCTGCLGTLAGVGTFARAAGAASHRDPATAHPSIRWSNGWFPGESFLYRYRLPGSPRVSRRARFGSGTGQALAIGFDREPDGAGLFGVSPVLGFASRSFDVSLGDEKSQGNRAVYFLGGEIENRLGGRTSAWNWYGQLRGGGGRQSAPRMDDLDDALSGSGEGDHYKGLRYFALEGGIARTVFEHGQIRLGLSWESLAMGHPEGHVNDSLFGGENQIGSLAAHVGLMFRF